MLPELVVIIVMMVILGTLGSSLFFLIRDGGNTNRTIKALTWRISLSFSLFLFLIIAFYLGWLTPHQILFNT